VKEPKNIIKK